MQDANWTCQTCTYFNKPLLGTNCIYKTSTLFQKLLQGANCTWKTRTSLHNPLRDPKHGCRTSTWLQMHIPNLFTGFTRLSRVLTVLAEPLTAWTSLLGWYTSWRLVAPNKPLPGFTKLFGVQILLAEPLPAFMTFVRAKCTCATSTRLHNLLGDGTCTFRPYTSLRAANCSYQTFTGVQKPLDVANCACRTSTSLYDPLQGANCTWRTTSSLH